MAKVAKRQIVWQSDPQFDQDGFPVMKKIRGVETDELDLQRIEVPLDGVIPDVVPTEVQEDWLKRDWIFEDPTRQSIPVPEGPPRVQFPNVVTQRIEHDRQRTHPSRRSGTIPPRPQPVHEEE